MKNDSQALLAALGTGGADFAAVLAHIDAAYDFTPTAFDNGAAHNAAGQNSGSCKVLSFAQIEGLSAAQTLFEIVEETGETVTRTAQGVIVGIPSTTPTVGLANSLGDALAPVKAASLSLAYAVESGMGWAGVTADFVRGEKRPG